MNIFSSPIRYLHCLNPAIITSVLFVLSALPWPSHCPNKWHLHRTLQAWLLPLTVLHDLPKYQINRLQHIQNALARTVVEAPKFQYITPILKSLRLKVFERFECNITSLTKFSIPLSLRISSTLYPFSLLNPHGHNKCFYLKSLWSNNLHHSVTYPSFHHASPYFWNQSPTQLRIFHLNFSPL